MKLPTDELLDLCLESDAEPRSGFTGGLDLYGELTGYSAPSPNVRPQTVWPDETDKATDGGALAESEDVIRITGALTGFVTSRSAAAVCGDCGNVSDGGEMFCIHCGGVFETAASAEALAGLCDDCGATVETDEIFCPSCGSVMATA